MEQHFVREALQKFAKNVVTQSRANLTRGNKNVNRKLYNSLGFDLRVHKRSFSLWFEMEEYGKFQDEGVKGADPSQVSPNAKIKGQQAPNSRFSFKQKRPPIKPLAAWAKSRGIRFRDAKGKYKEGGYDAVGYVISKNIWARGIKPSLFFTKPFEKHFDNLPDELIEKFGLELDSIYEKN